MVMKCRVIQWDYLAGCYSDDVLDLYLGGAQFKPRPGFLTVINEDFTIFLQSLKALPSVRVVPCCFIPDPLQVIIHHMNSIM